MNHVCGPSPRDALGCSGGVLVPHAVPEPMCGCFAAFPSALTRMYPTRLCLGEDIPG